MPHYDEARLVRLLRLLRAAPVEWVHRAQRIPLGSAPLTDRDLEELGRRLEQDASFGREFDADPVAAAKAAGMDGLGQRLQYELGELVALAQRVAREAGRREELVAALGDPRSALAVLSGSGAAEVEAHLLDRGRLEERALLLLLSSRAVGDELRSAVDRP